MQDAGGNCDDDDDGDVVWAAVMALLITVGAIARRINLHNSPATSLVDLSSPR